MSFHFKILKNTLYQIIARISSSGATFFIMIIIARHFGINGYGDFAKVTALVTLFYLLADFGFNAVFLQYEDARVHFKDLFYSRIILSILLICLINILAVALPYNPVTNIGFSPSVRLGIFIFSMSIITESILYTSSAIFQRNLTYFHFMISSIVGGVVGLGLVGLFALFSLPITYVYVSFVLSGIVESVTALLLTGERVFPPKLDHLFIRRLAKETFPITLLMVFNLIYFRIDMILLSALRSTRDVAIYDMAYNVFDFLIALPLFLSNALYPSILTDVKNTRTIPKAKRLVSLFVASSLFVIVPIWIGAPLLKIVRTEFIDSVIPLRILLISLPIFFGTNILQWLLIALKKQGTLAWIYFFSTIVNILLNVLFIPRYGYIASAIITGASEAGIFIALWVLLFSPAHEYH